MYDIVSSLQRVNETSKEFFTRTSRTIDNIYCQHLLLYINTQSLWHTRQDFAGVKVFFHHQKYQDHLTGGGRWDPPMRGNMYDQCYPRLHKPVKNYLDVVVQLRWAVVGDANVRRQKCCVL